MKFLPTENLRYWTELKEDEVKKRLADLIEPEKIFRFNLLSSSSKKPYEGQINGNTFTMKRIINYRNSFLPRIDGTVRKDEEGTTINVSMQLPVMVIVFLCIWCGGVSFACLAFLLQAFSDSAFSPAPLIPFGMLIFCYALTMGGFKYESSKSKKHLQKILEAEMAER